jgi:glycine/D-amino acid oxidase-like deaminating enzyme
MTPQKIGVVGAGLMGHGIAYLLAAAGHTVGIYDPSAEWRNSLAERLESARDLLGGDPALLGRSSSSFSPSSNPWSRRPRSSPATHRRSPRPRSEPSSSTASA